MRALVFDWETTGLSLHAEAKLNLQPRAIEFGGVVIDETGFIHNEYSFIIDPEKEIEPVITKITGLTNDDLKGKPKFKQIYPILRGIWEEIDVSFAHNHPFDKEIAEYEFQRLGVTDFPWARHEACTVQIYFDEYGRRMKLTELYEKVMGKKLEQTHRALDDCKALAEIVVKDNLLELFCG